MGRAEDPANVTTRWPRAIAHLAIVVVFVMAALGYAPFVQHSTDVTKVAGGTARTVASADRACDAHTPAAQASAVVQPKNMSADATDVSPKGSRNCARPEAQARR